MSENSANETEVIESAFVPFVTVDRDDFSAAVRIVSAAAARRSALPVLSNILLRVDGDGCTVSATNLEIGLSTTIMPIDREPGDITVDAKLLGDLVSTLPSGEIVLEREPERCRLRVTSGRNVAQLNGIPGEDFPTLLATGDELQLLIDAQSLKAMIDQVAFAAATDDSRPVLASLLMRMDGARLIMAAADGFRLAVAERDILAGDVGMEKHDALIPVRSAIQLSKLIGKTTEPLRVAFGSNGVSCTVLIGATTFTTRLVAGTFPDYTQIIPKDFATKITADRVALQKIAKRSAIFAKDNNDVLRFRVDGSEDRPPAALGVSATAAERGKVDGEIDLSLWYGKEAQIAANSKYLLDILGSLTSDSVDISMNGPSEAMCARPTGDALVTHVVMPMMMGAS